MSVQLYQKRNSRKRLNKQMHNLRLFELSSFLGTTVSMIASYVNAISTLFIKGGSIFFLSL